MSYIGRVCLRTGSRLFQGSQPIKEQFCLGWRQFRTKPRPVKVGAKPLEVGAKPLVEVGELPPVGMATLTRPVLFSLMFGGGTMAGCAIWQYENMRAEAQRTKFMSWASWKKQNEISRKAGDFREQIRQWWSKLPEGEKVFWPLCFLNVCVWVAWKIPAFQPAMLSCFTSNPGSRKLCLPMLLSTFSHFSGIHLAANMFVLHSFMAPAVHLLGKEQFLGVYLTSGVFTSLASYVHKVATARMGYSLGASGAICTVLGLFGTLVPDARMQILFLPMFTFTAASAIKGLMAIDTVGILAGWRFFDHAAHLSGIVYGIFWCYVGQRLVWENREPLVTWWHDIRTRE